MDGNRCQLTALLYGPAPELSDDAIGPTVGWVLGTISATGSSVRPERSLARRWRLANAPHRISGMRTACLPIHYANTSDGVRIAYVSVGDGSPLVFGSNIFGDASRYCGGDPHVREVTDRLVHLGWRVIRYAIAEWALPTETWRTWALLQESAIWTLSSAR